MLTKMSRMVHKKQKGFTLVELMVVVVIIGILTAIAVPIYNSVTAGASKAACIANQRTIESAIMQASASNGTATSSYTNLTQLTDFLVTTPVCKDGGTYTLKDGQVTCDRTDHSR